MNQAIFQSKVRDLSRQGLGVVDHPEGKVFFVPGVWPGDEGVFEITQEGKRYGKARLQKMIHSSPERMASPCPHQGFTEGQCGGCPWMMVRYEAQLLAKEKIVRQAFLRAGWDKVDLKLGPIIASHQIFGWRNRAQFKTNGKILGFVSPGTKTIAPIQDCLILSEKNRGTLAQLIKKLPSAEWKPGSGYVWNFLEIDEDLSADQVKLNQRRPFRQANPAQNAQIKGWLAEKLKRHSSDKKVLELFSGSGNLTELLVERGFSSVMALEANPESIIQLQQKKWPQVTVTRLDLFQKKSVSQIQKMGLDFEILLLDPPREGYSLLGELIRSLFGLQFIYYISCSLESLVRDLGVLAKQGWQMEEITPVDLFPHTPHIELLVALSKPDS